MADETEISSLAIQANLHELKIAITSQDNDKFRIAYEKVKADLKATIQGGESSSGEMIRILDFIELHGEVIKKMVLEAKEAKPTREQLFINDQYIERKITFPQGTLLLSAEIQAQIANLDRAIAEKEQLAEIIGFGLVKEEEGVTKVVEFISPDFAKILDFESTFINPAEKELFEFLGNDITDILVTLDGNNVNFQALFDKNKPEFRLLLKLEDIVSFLSKLGISLSETNPSVTYKNDWEIITIGTRNIVRKPYIERVNKRIQETGYSCGFTSHHHPNSHLGQSLVDPSTASVEKRTSYFHDLLQRSSQDIQTMSKNNIPFFEIRAMGTPSNPSDRVKSTSRYYSTHEEIELAKPKT
jgi:hypothetical protein